MPIDELLQHETCIIFYLKVKGYPSKINMFHLKIFQSKISVVLLEKEHGGFI